jgi:N-acetylglucosaminyldiphosphoundecaprenol N-acetyl-beta-D-mannosaminyltransferase
MRLRSQNAVLESDLQAVRTEYEPLRNEPGGTSQIGVLPINMLRTREIVDLAMRHLRKGRLNRSTLRVLGVNAQIANLAKTSRRFADAMSTGDILYADGVSIVLASKLLGSPLPERVPGGELMELLCKEGAKEGFSAYLLGGLPGAAETAGQILQERYPGLYIAGTCCPPLGFEQNAEESARIGQSIKAASPDFLFVCFGAPKQEIWVAENCSSLPVGLALPVGAAFDTLAGLRKRAPVWAQKTGTEWLYRLVKEPRRLWRRYLLGNPKFVWMTLLQRLERVD